MNATVTARVPVEVKAQVDRQLKAMGSSATELINAAYDYVLREGRIPRPETESSDRNESPQTKTLSENAAAEFRRAWASRSVLQALEYDGDNFKELLNEARGEHYARFA